MNRIIYTTEENMKHEQEMLEGLDMSQWDTWLSEHDVTPIKKED